MILSEVLTRAKRVALKLTVPSLLSRMFIDTNLWIVGFQFKIGKKNTKSLYQLFRKIKKGKKTIYNEHAILLHIRVHQFKKNASNDFVGKVHKNISMYECNKCMCTYFLILF